MLPAGRPVRLVIFRCRFALRGWKIVQHSTDLPTPASPPFCGPAFNPIAKHDPPIKKSRARRNGTGTIQHLSFQSSTRCVQTFATSGLKRYRSTYRALESAMLISPPVSAEVLALSCGSPRVREFPCAVFDGCDYRVMFPSDKSDNTHIGPKMDNGGIIAHIKQRIFIGFDGEWQVSNSDQLL